LLLTTPNPARLENLEKMVRDRASFSDPVSGYGIHGRHNREVRGERTQRSVFSGRPDSVDGEDTGRDADNLFARCGGERVRGISHRPGAA